MGEVDFFFALLRAGLWHESPDVSAPWVGSWPGIYQRAEEQAIAPIISDGIELLQSVYKENHWLENLPTKMEKRPFVIEVLKTEARYHELLQALLELTDLWEKEGIRYCLMKGPSVGRFYRNQQRRKSGDIDLFVSRFDYVRAKEVVRPMSSSWEHEFIPEMHQGFSWGSVSVEIHGTNDTSLSGKIDKELRLWRESEFSKCEIWNIQGHSVHVPRAELDVVYVFAHCLQHFYRGGIGLRQLCDWACLLDGRFHELDLSSLHKRLKGMGLLHEWQAFGSFVVRYIGLPGGKMPFYTERMDRKADMICGEILQSGNFGMKREPLKKGGKTLIGKRIRSFIIVSREILRVFPIFPWQTLRTYSYGLRLLVMGRLTATFDLTRNS